MHPVLFHLGGLAVHTYGVAIGVALVGGILLSVRLAVRDGLPAGWMWDVGLVLIGCVVVGARAEFVRTHLDRFTADPAAVFALRDGGLVFYGGLVACVIGVAVYARVRGVSPLRLMDHLAPSASLGHAVGRLGCFAAGCCYGRATEVPWGVVFPTGGAAPAGLPLHPAQLYEAAFDLALGLYLLWRWHRRRAPGEIAGVFFLYSATGRLLVERFRGDAQRGIAVWGLTNGQATSLVVAAVGLALTLHAAHRARRR